MTEPIHIWLDQETFPWHGVPDLNEDLDLNSPENKKKDDIVGYEIEHVWGCKKREFLYSFKK